MANNLKTRLRNCGRMLGGNPWGFVRGNVAYLYRHRSNLLDYALNYALNWLRSLPWISKQSSGLPSSLELVYINLDARTDRRAYMDGMLDKLGVRARRFPAVSGDEDDLRARYPAYFNRGVAAYLYDDPAHAKRRRGVIGCYLSHRLLIEGIADSDGYLLIMEDDICIYSPLFFAQAVRWAESMDRPWDLLLFDCHGTYWKGDRVRRNLYYPSKFHPIYNGAHAVLVRKDRKEKILDVLSRHGIVDIDGIYIDNQIQIEAYVVRTGLCTSLFRYGSDISIA